MPGWRFWEKAPQPSSAPPPSQIAAAVGNGRSTPKRGAEQLLLAYRESPWLKSAVGRIAQSVAATEWQLWMGDKQLTESPFLDLIKKGNGKLSGRDCMEVTQLHLDLLGEAFWVLEGNAAGMPVAFWPMPPSWVSQVPNNASAFYEIRVRGVPVKFDPLKVVWFKSPDPADPYARGVGTGEALGDELDTDEYAAEFLKTFFYNGASVDAVVSIKGASEPQVREIESKWSAKFQGSRNGHRTAFTSAEVSVDTMSQSFKDMAVVELRNSLRDNIVQAFGVSPEILGIIENSNRSTIDGAETMFAKFVLVPRLARLQVGLQSLAEKFDERLWVGYISPVPADREFQLKTMTQAKDAFTVGEWRQLAGLDVRPGDDVAYKPTQPQFPPEPPAKSLRTKAPALVAEDLVGVWEGLEAVPLKTNLTPIIGQQMQATGALELASLGVSLAFDMQNPLVLDHIALFAGEHITGINDTTKEALKSALYDGIEAGEGYKDLAARVSDVFADAAGYRAEAIARTEAVGANNAATYSADVQSGVVDYRQWIDTPDDRTRDEHAKLGGQVRALGEEFEVDGYSALYPGGFGDPAMDVNCRCTTGAVRKDEEGAPIPITKEMATEMWKAMDKRLLAWERQYKRAARKAFAAQEKAALAALEAAAR